MLCAMAGKMAYTGHGMSVRHKLMVLKEQVIKVLKLKKRHWNFFPGAWQPARTTAMM